MMTLYVFNDRTASSINNFPRSLQLNISNGGFDRIFVLESSDTGMEQRLQHPKVQLINLGETPTLRDAVDAINRMTTAPDDVQIFARAGVYFDREIAQLIEWDLDATCLALTPWEVQADGAAYPQLSDESQVCWIFQGRIRPLSDIDVPLANADSSRLLVRELRKADYRVINPSFGVKAYIPQAFVNGSPAAGLMFRVDVPRCQLVDAALGPKRPVRTGVIAFSLFGHNEKYMVGAVENARIAKYIYPGWTVRFYVDNSVPTAVIQQLRHLHADIVPMPMGDGMTGLFWRFLAADEAGFARWMIRDVDSRFSDREHRAVDEWIDSSLSFHAMRDHPLHTRPIMGCAFSGVRGALSSMRQIISSWQRKGRYGDDELMLAETVYPMIRNRMLVHDAFAKSYNELVRPFPVARENFRFVGERFGPDETVDQSDREKLIKALYHQRSGQ
jgi:hypothetical protein